jgi:hypothetical protein
MKTGTMTTPLHGGKAPAWLFMRMQALAREIISTIVIDFGTEELLKRLSEPLWFQALGCVLGFDWHSSGVTTTVCGALKAGINGRENELGLYICGGKGGRSRKTPEEIEGYCARIALAPQGLVRSSRLSAKVDNNALQDGYQLYHHAFFFDRQGRWSVVQQGMNTAVHTARRYHWTGIELKDYVEEPHSGICTEDRVQSVFDLTARQSRDARNASVEILKQGPDSVLSELKKCKAYHMPRRHAVLLNDIHPDNIKKVLIQTYEQDPQDFTALLEAKGAGPKTIRALALLSEIIYGTEVSRVDPAVFAFAHGGKDGTPYPVHKGVYDQSIQILKTAVEQARIGDREKFAAMRKLARWR